MLVCIDKITCARMLQLIVPRWRAKVKSVRAAAEAKRVQAQAEGDQTRRAALEEEAKHLAAQAAWLDETIVEIIISEAQNEVKDFAKWGFDIIPHRALMKQGFETPDGKPMDVETAFKTPDHPFRVAIVCAMWLTGFDVECLSTLYVDKPMKAHTLMQAIARANRVYPGKDFGLIVDYNGMLKSLREALAQYALGDDGDGSEEIVAPVEGACAGPDRGHRGGRGAPAQAGLRPGNAPRFHRFRAHQGTEGCGRSRLFQRQGQAPIRNPGPAGVRPLQGIANGAFGLCLRRAARQSRGDLQEADGAAAILRM